MYPIRNLQLKMHNLMQLIVRKNVPKILNSLLRALDSIFIYTFDFLTNP
jgi:hypothetical protein